MTRLPLRTSLTIVYTSMLALFVTLLAVSYHYVMARQINRDAARNLEEKARGLHGYLRFRNGMPVLVYNHDDPAAAAFIDDATDFYQVYEGGDGRLLTQSPGLRSLRLNYTPRELEALRSNPGSRDVQTDRGRLRLSTTVISPTPDEVYVVQVGELMDRIDAALMQFDRLLLWTILVGLVCAAVIGRLLAGRALAPLSRLADATRAIDIRNLRDRLAVRGVDDEPDRVAQAFNDALARVEHSVEEMRQFSAALAHELRTPLAILRGEAESALRSSSSAEDLRQALARQVDEFDRLTRLINQILTLARAEAGEIMLAEQPVDLSALGSSVAEQIEPVAAARDITLTCEAQQEVMVRGDAGWLERLLLILLDNAIKFTPDGGRVALTLSAADGTARVAVSDNGIGIAPAEVPHLFERFYRADPARSRKVEGAGLGLALARWIAERHDATIDVKSQPGHGSTFTVRFAH